MTYLVESCEPRDGRHRVVTRAKGARWPRLALLVADPLPVGLEVSLEMDGAGGLRFQGVQAPAAADEVPFPAWDPPSGAPEAPQGPQPGPGGP